MATWRTTQVFGERVKESKRSLLEFLIAAKRDGKQIVGYGAPGKGNTLLNYCGIRTDFIDYTVDRSPHKQGNFLPGTRIPIFAPERIRETKPDYVLILCWNLQEEVVEQMGHIREWGGQVCRSDPRGEGVAGCAQRAACSRRDRCLGRSPTLVIPSAARDLGPANVRDPSLRSG